MVTTTPEQDRQLMRHAAARNLSSPEEALQALLDQAPPSKRPWTPAEIALVRNLRNTPRDIAARTGRTPTAVSNKRTQLLRSDPPPAPA